MGGPPRPSKSKLKIRRLLYKCPVPSLTQRTPLPRDGITPRGVPFCVSNPTTPVLTDLLVSLRPSLTSGRTECWSDGPGPGGETGGETGDDRIPGKAHWRADGEETPPATSGVPVRERVPEDTKGRPGGSGSGRWRSLRRPRFGPDTPSSPGVVRLKDSFRKSPESGDVGREGVLRHKHGTPVCVKGTSDSGHEVQYPFL